MISGGRDTFYFTESFFFDVIQNITEKGGGGGSYSPPWPHPYPPPPYSLKSDDYCVTLPDVMLCLECEQLDEQWPVPVCLEENV